jgi:predicted dehydrogenase
MNKLRVGIVGLGSIAQNAHLPAIEKARDIHLQAIADTDAALIDQVRVRYRPETVHKHSDDLSTIARPEGQDTNTFRKKL